LGASKPKAQTDCLFLTQTDFSFNKLYYLGAVLTLVNIVYQASIEIIKHVSDSQNAFHYKVSRHLCDLCCSWSNWRN